MQSLKTRALKKIKKDFFLREENQFFKCLCRWWEIADLLHTAAVEIVEVFLDSVNWISDMFDLVISIIFNNIWIQKNIFLTHRSDAT